VAPAAGGDLSGSALATTSTASTWISSEAELQIRIDLTGGILEGLGETASDLLEFIALTTRLRSSEAREIQSLSERTLIWLSIAFGCNSIGYALLREEDYRPLPERGTGRLLHRLYVPRTKKRGYDVRKGFRPEMLNDEIGRLVGDLVAENRAARATSEWPRGCAFPLFARQHVRDRLLGGERHEYAMHLTTNEILQMVKAAVDKLGIVGTPKHHDRAAIPSLYRDRSRARGCPVGGLDGTVTIKPSK
jgi:hypothetical protein